ncbi:MAG TPA: nucleotidyltransferase family protein [Anaerolineae bacterium]|nr:nucleotidyltransferase family protein [Anaerolineae bacterium]
MIAAILLAAGQSRRMGQNKLFLPYAASTMIETIVAEIAACEAIDDIVVVTGYEADRVAAQLVAYRVRCVFNPQYAQAEMLVSIQTGLRALTEGTSAALIVLGDQPRLRRDIVQRVIDAAGSDTLIIPSFQMKRGHPILIPRSIWPSVLSLPPEATLRDVIRANADHIRYVTFDDDSVLRDIDTPEDYQNINR